MTPEEEARQDIDKLLEAAGWRVQYWAALGVLDGRTIHEMNLRK
jgi:hypothetical protein